MGKYFDAGLFLTVVGMLVAYDLVVGPTVAGFLTPTSNAGA
jgi:hypothetical protein